MIFFALLTSGAAIHRFAVVSSAVMDADRPTRVDRFDNRYNQHPYLSYLHLLPGVIFMVLGPLQFSRRIRAKRLNFHRWSGRVFLGASLIGVGASLVMAVRFPIFGGYLTGSATYVFGLLFAVSLLKAYYYIRRKEILLHREWMIRAFAIGLGVSTIRVVAIVLVIAARGRLEDIFGLSFWIGWIINVIAAEIWITSTRIRAHAIA